MPGSHVTIAVAGREARFLDPEILLATVRAIARIAGPCLLLFCVVDEHLHLVLSGSREEVGRIAGRLAQALTKGLGIRLEAARIRDVDGRAHLESLIGYLLSQPHHHGLGAHPATWAGSCIHDLLGARIVEGFDADRIARALPRCEIAAMAGVATGLGEEPLEEPSAGLSRELGAAALWRASGAAIARKQPSGRSPAEMAARIGYAHMVAEAGIVAREARETAGIPEPTWYRLVAMAPSVEMMRAIRLQLALQRRATERPMLALLSPGPGRRSPRNERPGSHFARTDLPAPGK